MDYISLGIIIVVLIGTGAVLWYAISNKLEKESNSTQLNELQENISKLNNELELTKYKLQQKELELANTQLNFQKLEVQLVDNQKKYVELNNKYQVTNEAKIRIETENTNLHSSYKQLEEVVKQFKQTFDTEFNNLRQLTLKELNEKANLTIREVGKDAIVEPLQNNLKSLQEKILQLEVQTKTMNESSLALNKQAENLAIALTRDSKKKGDFGELILANLLESVGLQDKISYTEQLQLNHNDKRYIPDMVINLPHNRAVVIDSKNIMKQYAESVNNAEIYDARALLRVISATVKGLSSKDYAAILGDSFSRNVFAYSIMFIPNESLFLAILAEDQEQNCALIREAYQQKVFIAGPSTLLALLSMIDKAWETYQVEERAEEIIKLATDVSAKIHTTIERIAKLGSNIKGSVACYNDIIKSLDNGTSASVVAKLGKISERSGSKENLPIINYIDAESKLPSSYTGDM